MRGGGLGKKYMAVIYELTANVYDEWQIECREGTAEEVGRKAAWPMNKVGGTSLFKCPLEGEY
jgi:hypothetical protein